MGCSGSAPVSARTTMAACNPLISVSFSGRIQSNSARQSGGQARRVSAWLRIGPWQRRRFPRRRSRAKASRGASTTRARLGQRHPPTESFGRAVAPGEVSRTGNFRVTFRQADHRRRFAGNNPRPIPGRCPVARRGSCSLRFRNPFRFAASPPRLFFKPLTQRLFRLRTTFRGGSRGRVRGCA
jgi:hypothetical protein